MNTLCANEKELIDVTTQAIQDYADIQYKDAGYFHNQLLFAGFDNNWVFDNYSLNIIMKSIKNILKDKGKKTNLNRDTRSVWEFIVYKQLQWINKK